MSKPPENDLSLPSKRRILVCCIMSTTSEIGRCGERPPASGRLSLRCDRQCPSRRRTTCRFLRREGSWFVASCRPRPRSEDAVKGLQHLVGFLFGVIGNVQAAGERLVASFEEKDLGLLHHVDHVRDRKMR